jgi:hypothetical protein
MRTMGYGIALLYMSTDLKCYEGKKEKGIAKDE